MGTRTAVKPGTVLVVLALAAVAVGVFGPLGQPLRNSVQGRVIRAEAEMQDGEFEVVLASWSSVHQFRSHVEGVTYKNAFGHDILLEKGETLTVHLTAATDFNSESKQTLTCRLRDNGKEVDKHTLSVRSGQPVGCRMTFQN